MEPHPLRKRLDHAMGLYRKADSVEALKETHAKFEELFPLTKKAWLDGELEQEVHEKVLNHDELLDSLLGAHFFTRTEWEGKPVLQRPATKSRDIQQHLILAKRLYFAEPPAVERNPFVEALIRQLEKE